MDVSRKAALDSLNRCFKDGAWSSQLINSQAKKYQLDDRDLALASNIILGVLQNYMLLDFWINHYCSKLDLTVRNILRMGVYQIRFSDRIPDRAAVNECVELCKHSGYKSASGLVNAVLRKISAEKVEYPQNLYQRYSHPKWFVDRMIEIHGRAFTEELLAADNKEAIICKRKAFSDELYVQDEAAHAAVQMLGLRPGMRVLDCCAAPGGKSFTAAVQMKNRGEIISCDIHEKKLNLIEQSAKKLGIQIIQPLCADASEFRPEFENSFDAVIADVPCSGFGVIRKKPEIRFKSAEDIAGLPVIQKKILNNVSRYLKNDGKLLYSTCTIFKEENEEVAESLEGFEIIDQHTFYPNIDGTDGFYAAVLQRK